MFEYANKALSNYICTHLHSFPKQESGHWIKADSKYHFTQEISDIYFYHFIKIENTVNSQKEKNGINVI